MSFEGEESNFFQENEKMLSDFVAPDNSAFLHWLKNNCEKTKAKSFYFYVLTKVRESVMENQLNDFVRFFDAIESMTDAGIVEKEFLSDEGYPLFDTNLIILACKYKSQEVLENLLRRESKILGVLSPENSEISVLHPDHMDSEQHNAFYYAIRSDSIDVLSTLIHEWPGMNFTSNPRKLEQLLSAAYDELKLKRVPLSDEIETFVESKLIDLKFWSENSLSVKDTESDTNNIIARIKLMIEKIEFLKKEYSRADVDDVFLLTGKFILQNMHVLKRQLRSTYNKLPWEEVEFCLVSFISSQIKYHEINLLTALSLNKESIINYLEIFGKKLNEVVLEEGYFNNTDFNILPKTPRDEIVAQIIESNPEFRDLYDDYKKVRDIYSLETIRVHLNFIAEANLNEKEGQLTMTRALQVIGEHFKNTLESPKLSKAMSELLLSSLSLSTKKIIVDLRDALSHSSSLSQRTEIEQQADDNFYNGIQNDAKLIEGLVVDIILNNEVECARSLLRKIMSAKGLDDLQKIAKAFNKVNARSLVLQSENYEMKTRKKLEEMLEELRKIVTDPNDIEELYFSEIDEVLEPFRIQTEIAITHYSASLGSVINGLITLEEDKMQGNYFHNFQSGIRQFEKGVNVFTFEVKECDLKSITQRAMIICESVKSRIGLETQEEVKRLNDIHILACKFFCFAEIKTNDIKWLEPWREQLLKKGPVRPSQEQGGTPEGTEPKSEDALSLKLHELQIILKNYGLGGETVEILTSIKKQQKLQPVIELLLLDIMSILSGSMKPWESNLFFFDDCVPLLNGKFLRDHLAHGNILVDLLSYDPSMAIFLNAKKFSGIEDFSRITKKIGKFIVDIPSLVQARHDQKLAIISTQENLFSALAEGNLEAVRTCLRKGADMNARNIKGQTATHFACMGSNLDVLKFTFEQTSNSNLRDVMGQTPLHVAAKYDSGIIRYLLERGLQVDASDTFLNTPLIVAAKNGQKKAVKVLLINDACAFARNQDGLAALHYAIRCNHIDVVKILLEREENVDSNESSGGFTPLHIATECGYLDIVNFLLSKKANVNKTADYGMVPLHSAALFGHLEVVEALIQSGADVNVRVVPKKAKIISATVTPLHFAFRSGHNSTVEILIAKVDINFATPLRNCSTPLHAAAQGGHVKVVEILLEHGAVVSTVDDQNRTPLDIAVLGGSLEIVKMLFKQDEIYINGKDSEGWTMLEHASRGGNVELVKFLVANGADINVANHNTLTGTKPIHTAAADGRTNILEFFLECGMSVHEVDYDGQTPLHYAAEFGKHEMVNYLITRGADVNYKNYMGWMPIHNAASDEHEETVKVLLQNGAIYDAIDIYGNTPLGITGHQGVKSLLKSTDDLFAAMTENNCARVKELIAEGAIIDAKQSVVGAPILYAAWQGYNDIIDCLLENGANPNSTNVTGFTPLHCAVKNSQYKATVALLHKGAIYNCANIEKLTPLDFATDEKIIELLDMIDKTFRKVDSRDTTVISDLRKITDREIVKAIMRACSRKRESLMVTAINNSFPAIEDLEKIFQDDTLVNESQT